MLFGRDNIPSLQKIKWVKICDVDSDTREIKYATSQNGNPIDIYKDPYFYFMKLEKEGLKCHINIGRFVTIHGYGEVIHVKSVYFASIFQPERIVVDIAGDMDRINPKDDCCLVKLNQSEFWYIDKRTSEKCGLL